MLPCVCSVIDHRWRQNVVRTKKWHTRRSRVCHWCSYHILTSSVIYYWIRRTAIWNRFVSYNNEKPFLFQIFQRNAKAGFLPCPRLCMKKAIWRDLWSIQNEAISLVAMRSKELWLVEKNRATVSNLTRASLLVEWKLTAKAELNCEIYKSWRKYWKNPVSFCHRSSPVCRRAWKLAWKLQELKKYPRKTCGYGQPGGHLIRVLNAWSVNDGDIFVFCSWWFSNHLDIVSEAYFSCDTVGRGLWLAILNSLLCPETDRNIRIGKQGYVTYFYFWCFDVLIFHSWHQSACQQLFWHWEKLNDDF